MRRDARTAHTALFWAAACAVALCAVHGPALAATARTAATAREHDLAHSPKVSSSAVERLITILDAEAKKATQELAELKAEQATTVKE